MRPHHLSIAFLISFLLTVFFLQYWQLPQYPQQLWILVGLLGFFGILGLLLQEGHRTGSLIAAGTFGLAIAFTTVARTTHVPSPHTIDWYATGKHGTVIGTIAREPDTRPLVTKYTIAAQIVNNIPVQGLVLINDYAQFPEYKYGEEITVTGKLERPDKIENFEYDKYLSRYGIYSVMYRGHVQEKNEEVRSDECWGSGECTQEKIISYVKIGTPTSSKELPRFFAIKSFLYSLKSRFEEQINRIFPEPHASLLAGLLTGSRRGIPEHLLDDFNATGLTHIIAISGYNITIILAIISGSLFFLPLRRRFIPATIAIVLFTILVGAEASVVRAAIMGILGLLALHTGRQKESRLLILWTLFFMLAYNPKYLWYDAGFQLSFLAILGLIELSPILAPYLKHVPHTFAINESLQMTLASQWFAIPWIAYLFGRISLISPLANILVALPVPLAMLFGFIGVTVSFLSFPLGQIISYIAWFFLEFVIQIAVYLSRVPFASLDIPGVNSASVIAYYVFLVLWITTHTQTLSFPKPSPSKLPSLSGM
ncbi:ComEC family competence protein [Candidatus Peregrinibacteria bacterium]|nr:ComEC family competence protein [Candidatus Peregrinibacteria bacterium]